MKIKVKVKNLHWSDPYTKQVQPTIFTSYEYLLCLIFNHNSIPLGKLVTQEYLKYCLNLCSQSKMLMKVGIKLKLVQIFVLLNLIFNLNKTMPGTMATSRVEMSGNSRINFYFEMKQKHLSLIIYHIIRW